MGAVTLRWTDRSTQEIGQRIYRSEEPIDLENLPPVLTTVAANVETYRDESVEEDKVYYYVVSSYTEGLERFSEPIVVDTSYKVGPGPNALMFGDERMGFFGEVPSSELITGLDLSTIVKVTQGTLQPSDEPWLKFTLDGKLLFVSKKPIRHNISWNHLNSLDLVYGGKIIEINGYQFKIRLLTGADTDPTSVSSGHYMEGTHNSEFSRLFYPIIKDDTYLPVINPLAPYTQAELIISSGSGRYNWCQETSALDATRHVYRGNTASSYFTTDSGATSSHGWRACLELVTQ